MATAAPTSEHREYLTAHEAAELLRVSRHTIWRAVERGTLPAIRLAEGGPLRIPASALEARKQPA